MILFLDNYDAFPYHLYQYVGALYPDLRIIRSDEISLEEMEEMQPDALLLSNGAGHPKDAGISVAAIQRFGGTIPILGIGLGHLAIAEAFGGTMRAEKQYQQTTHVAVDTHATLFQEIAPVFVCSQDTALFVEEATLPDCLRMTARSESGQVMALEHRAFPIYGLQFYPESVRNGSGRDMLIAFLKLLPDFSVLTEVAAASEGNAAIRPYTEQIVHGIDLTAEEAETVMQWMMEDAVSAVQIAELFTALRIKGETAAELTGFARGMRAKIKPFSGCREAVQLAGTGGDMSASSNIFTAAAFVAAAGGAKAAKFGSSRISGAVPERLGIRLQNTPKQAMDSLQETGVSFLIPPDCRGTGKPMEAARAELGVRTVLDLLMPLVVPFGTERRLLGVQDAALLPVMAEVLCHLGVAHAMVVHGKDGLDAISISAPTLVAEIRDGSIQQYEITPEQFGLPYGTSPMPVSGSPEENALLIQGILSGLVKDEKRNVVLLNAGCVLYLAGQAESIGAGVALAAEMIHSGAALTVLELLSATAVQQMEQGL